jgi:hypothetical protein
MPFKVVYLITTGLMVSGLALMAFVVSEKNRGSDEIALWMDDFLS